MTIPKVGVNLTLAYLGKKKTPNELIIERKRLEGVEEKPLIAVPKRGAYRE